MVPAGVRKTEDEQGRFALVNEPSDKLAIFIMMNAQSPQFFLNRITKQIYHDLLGSDQAKLQKSHTTKANFNIALAGNFTQR